MHEEEHLPVRWVTPQMERKSSGSSGGRGRKPALRAKRPPAQLHAAAGILSTSLPAVNGEETVNCANQPLCVDCGFNSTGIGGSK